MAAEAASKTNYLILFSKEGRQWEIVGQLDAPGQQSAIRQYTLGMTEVDGQWAAIPSRSFQPVRIKPKVVTSHQLEFVHPAAAKPPAAPVAVPDLPGDPA